MYCPTAYFLAHFISSLPQLIAQPIVYSLPIYFGCNARAGSGHVLMFIAVNIVTSLTINGLVWMCVSIHRNFSVASLLANTNFTFITLVAGFLVNSDTLPIYVKWVKNISFLSYAYRILMTNQYSNYIVPNCVGSDNANCYGNDILAQQGIAVDDYLEPWTVMFAICITYYLIAGTLLHFVRNPVTGVVGGEMNEETVPVTDDNREISGPNNNKNDTPNNTNDMVVSVGTVDVVFDNNIENVTNNTTNNTTNKTDDDDAKKQNHSTINNENNNTTNSDGADGMTVNIRNMYLHVTATNTSNTSATTAASAAAATAATAVVHNNNISTSTNITGSKYKKTILHNISADIVPGRLVALMGGSGSGEILYFCIYVGFIFMC